MLSAVVALALVPQGTQTPETPGQTPAGAGAQTAPAVAPLPVFREDVPSTEYLTWRGWGYLQGATSTVPNLYPGVGDWFALASATPAPDAAVWRTKFVIFRSAERLGQDATGLLRADRFTIEENQIGEVQAAIQRLALHLAAATGGRVRLVPEVVVEAESVRGPLEEDAFGPAFLQAYLRPRLNGGGYEAEDKVYRGPYHSVICLLPGTVEPKEAHTTVYGMPATAVSIEDLDHPFVAGQLDAELWRVTAEHAAQRAVARGYATAPTEGTATDAAWTEVTKFGEPTGAELLALAERPTPLVLGAGLAAAPPSRPTWRTPQTEVGIATDTDKGQVLRLVLKGPTRAAGIALPSRNDGQPIVRLADNHTLNLSLRTLAKDPIAFRLEGRDGKRAWVALQPEVRLKNEVARPVLVAPVKADGTWERIAVDFSAVAKEAGIDEVTALSVEFSPRARQTMRTLAEPMELFLDDVHFSNDPASGTDTAPNEVETKARIAAQATATSPELVAMLSERVALVRLNAADAFTRIKDPAAEDALATLAMGIDSNVADRALHALAFQGTETAQAGIRRAVRVAINDHSRGLAGLLLADSKDPRNGGDLATLLAHRNWQTRLAGVQALAKLPNREAAILRLAFLAQDNPEIKLATIEAVDANDEPQVRRLLWAAVNEPQDLVRAASALKLIQSPLEELRREGYKAVRDDSPTTRRLVLEALAARPNETHRDALRLGIADRNPSVRAAAILAFAALEKGATEEELAPALEDNHPDVQVALVQYATRRKVKLPSATVERLRNSPFARVREAAKGL
jgi:HEAT repeat protein